MHLKMLFVLEAVVPYKHKHFSKTNNSSKQTFPSWNPVSSSLLPEISIPCSCKITVTHRLLMNHTEMQKILCNISHGWDQNHYVKLPLSAYWLVALASVLVSGYCWWPSHDLKSSCNRTRNSSALGYYFCPTINSNYVKIIKYLHLKKYTIHIKMCIQNLIMKKLQHIKFKLFFYYVTWFHTNLAFSWSLNMCNISINNQLDATIAIY